MKIGMFFQEITSITEFPASNFLLPTIQTGSKWDFQAANLLLATINFEPCQCRNLLQTIDISTKFILVSGVNSVRLQELNGKYM